jgi:hypothetical protein
VPPGVKIIVEVPCAMHRAAVRVADTDDTGLSFVPSFLDRARVRRRATTEASSGRSRGIFVGGRVLVGVWRDICIHGASPAAGSEAVVVVRAATHSGQSLGAVYARASIIILARPSFPLRRW